MTRFITALFAPKSTSRPAARKTNLTLTAMEDRYAPAVVNPGTIRGFNPQPEPPGDVSALFGMTYVGTTRGIVISGG